MTITFILGGASSGKSCRAESLAKGSGLPVTYIATSPEFEGDEDWQTRIARHRAQRPAIWETREEQLNLVACLQSDSNGERCFLVDCLTLWLSNIMYAKRDVLYEVHLLCEALSASQYDVILVSNELGMGLIPEQKLGRDFRDAQGLLNQRIAKVANHVEFVVAGLPLQLKGTLSNAK